LFIPQHNLDGPIRTRRNDLQPEEVLENRATLILRHSLGQRTQFRIVFDVLTRCSGRTIYKRLRRQSVFLNVGDPEQAELAIEAILTFAQSLDGKWLAPSAPDQSVGNVSQTTDSAMLREPDADRVTSAEDSQAISGTSADDACQVESESRAQEPSGLKSQQDTDE